MPIQQKGKCIGFFSSIYNRQQSSLWYLSLLNCLVQNVDKGIKYEAATFKSDN